jgi:hypothetical protein
MNEAFYFAAPIARRDDGAVVAGEVVEAGCSKPSEGSGPLLRAGRWRRRWERWLEEGGA